MAYKAGWQQVMKPMMQIVGMDARTTNAAEADPKAARIGLLWGRFMTEDPLARVTGRKNPGQTIACYTSYASDHRGEYTIIVGEEIDLGRLTPEDGLRLAERPPFERRPDGLASVTIPPTGYMPFKAKGPMPAALIEAWQGIWKHFDEHPTPRRAYTTDLEIHKPDEVEIYVALAVDDAANRTFNQRMTGR